MPPLSPIHCRPSAARGPRAAGGRRIPASVDLLVVAPAAVVHQVAAGVVVLAVALELAIAGPGLVLRHAPAAARHQLALGDGFGGGAGARHAPAVGVAALGDRAV